MTDLESPEQLDCLFTASLHKIKFHIFQNISKGLIHGLIPLNYKNTCELYDTIKYKEKRGNIMTNNIFLYVEAIYIFNKLINYHNRNTVISS